ncbi:MAG: hypothetical protein Q4Q06_07270, partial [Bacteroidota bacterium]|nr:hypothetical protein [Bacteroidota bacterium]
IIEDYINRIHNNFSVEEEDKQTELLSIAEKIAIPYGMFLSENEIMKLLAELFKLPIANILPNGEKVLLKVDKDFCDQIFISKP